MNKIDEKLKDNTDFKLLLDKAFIYFRKYDSKNTIDSFENILKLYPNYIDGYFWLSFYLYQGAVECEEAIKVAKQGLQIDPSNAGLHAVIAWAIEFMAGDEKEFLYHLEKCIELDPTFMGAKISLIEYLIKSKRLAEAQQELEIAFAQSNDFTESEDPIEQTYNSISRRDKSVIKSLLYFKHIIESGGSY